MSIKDIIMIFLACAGGLFVTIPATVATPWFIWLGIWVYVINEAFE